MVWSALVPAASAAEAGPFRFDAYLGPSFVQSTQLTGYDDYESGRIRFDPGARLSLGLRYAITEAWSAGLETGFICNFTTLETSSGFSTDAGLYQVPFLGVVQWEVPTGTRLHPFLSAGVGGIHTTLVDYDFWEGESDSELGLGWQAAAGLRYALSSKMDLGLAYQYLGATDRLFRRLESRIDGTHTHAVTAAFTLKF